MYELCFHFLATITLQYDLFLARNFFDFDFDDGPSLQRKMSFVTFKQRTLMQTNKNRRLLDQFVC